MLNTEKPLTIELSSEEGNAYVIIGTCKKVLEKSGLDTESVKFWMDKMKSSDDYEDLCRMAEKAIKESTGKNIKWLWDDTEVTLNKYFTSVYGRDKRQAWKYTKESRLLEQAERIMYDKRMPLMERKRRVAYLLKALKALRV